MAPALKPLVSGRRHDVRDLEREHPETHSQGLMIRFVVMIVPYNASLG
jgi:hypothetical protein